MTVYVLVHNFVSHDMFVPDFAKFGNPRIVGVYTTRDKANGYVRKDADDSVHELELDAEPQWKARR